uniref:Uncharacterized protein n=1 Tax=Ditylenchus dipsaci TaxID=166011 RepID=A0A915DFS4_9BILA
MSYCKIYELEAGIIQQRISQPYKNDFFFKPTKPAATSSIHPSQWHPATVPALLSSGRGLAYHSLLPPQPTFFASSTSWMLFTVGELSQPRYQSGQPAFFHAITKKLGLN